MEISSANASAAVGRETPMTAPAAAAAGGLRLPAETCPPEVPAPQFVGPFRAAITAEEINGLPMGHYRGPIQVVSTQDAAHEAVAALQRESVLGFDTETRAVFRKGVSYPPALVQVAAAETVYIFRLRHLTHLGGLGRVFADASILKAGVAIAFDLRKLRELHAFEPAGFVELQTLTDRIGIRQNGLRALTALIIGIRISKSAQRTNWDRPDLTDSQLRYAATDAWACREMYLRLRSHGLLPAAGAPFPRSAPR
jgi:hypothetical protein